MRRDTSSSEPERHYYAFISYSHRKKRWGRWVHKSLERFRIPKRLWGRETRFGPVPRKLYPIFRDDDELPTGAVLTENIHQALRNSDCLVVLCSPEAAQSDWVNKEIKYFKQLGRQDRIFPVIIDGEPNAEIKDNGCFPEALLYDVDEQDNLVSEPIEPIAADARPAPEFDANKLWRLIDRIAGFSRAKALRKTVAGLTGVPYAEIWPRDVIYRTVVGTVTTCLVCISVYLGATNGLRFLSQKNIERHVGYANDMELVQHAAEKNNWHTVIRLLEKNRNYYDRGIEWDYWWSQSHQDILSIRAHKGTVASIAFSTNETKLATGGTDKTAKIWDLKTGHLLSAFPGHKDTVSSVAFSHDGKYLLTASLDRTAKIWNVNTGEKVRSFELARKNLMTPRASVKAIFSPDDKRILAYGFDGTATIYDVATGKEVLSVPLSGSGSNQAHSESYSYGNAVRCAAFSPDGTRIVTGHEGSQAAIWDLATGEKRDKLSMIGNPDYISYSLDGNNIVASSSYARGCVWDLKTRKRVHTLEKQEIRSSYSSYIPLYIEHTTNPYPACITKDGRSMAFGSETTLNLVRYKKSQIVFKGHYANITKVAFSEDGKLLASGDNNGQVKLWDTSVRIEPDIVCHIDYDDASVISPEGDQFIIIATSGIQIKKQELVSAGNASEVYSSLRTDVSVSRWDTETGRRLSSTTLHNTDGIYHVSSMSVSPNGKLLAIPGSGEVRIWDTETGRQLLTLHLSYRGRLASTVFSPDSKHILTTTESGTGKIWEVKTGKQVVTLSSYADGVAAFSPDGSEVAVGCSDFNIRIWNTKSAKIQHVMKGHTGSIVSVSFSKDGKRLLSTGRDGTVRQWNISREKQIMLLTNVGHTVSAVFSHDSKRLLTVDNTDKNVRLWDLVSCRPLLVLGTGCQEISSAALNKDGSAILIAGRPCKSIQLIRRKSP